MNPFFSRNNNLDEVVFENRNKEYGAYAMRKSYDSNLLKASASSFGFLIICMGTFYVLGLFPKELPPMPLPPQIIPDETKIHDIVVIPDPVTDLPAAGARNTHPNVFRIVSDHLVTQVQPTIPSDPVLPHNPNGTEGGTVGGETGGVQGGTVINPGTIPPPEPSAFETYVSEMPAFPGGADAMADYLSKHMNYPAIARENGIEGKVVIAFLVKTDGSIEILELIRGIGFGCDDEAMRVVAGMPKWSVGKHNGHAKVVKLVLPIQFKLH